MKASDLKPGDTYSVKGRVCPPRRVRKVTKSGAFVLVSYDYRVLDARGDDGATKWYCQSIPPIERLHVNKHVELEVTP